METKDIEALIAIMDQSNLSELEIDDGKTRIALRKNIPIIATTPAPTAIVQASLPANSAAQTKSDPQGCESNFNFHVIKSPMVGTFYSSPSPDMEAFVSIGSKVEKETAVCILEAMKVMNEIQSDVSGIIREVLVKNGQAVEFGQPLFKIEVC